MELTNLFGFKEHQRFLVQNLETEEVIRVFINNNVIYEAPYTDKPFVSSLNDVSINSLLNDYQFSTIATTSALDDSTYHLLSCLKKKYKYIVRDLDNSLWLTTEEPTRDEDSCEWCGKGEFQSIPDLFDFDLRGVMWDNPVPLLISQLLKDTDDYRETLYKLEQLRKENGHV